MSVGAFVYQKITRRFSTLFLAASFGAFFMNYAFNEATDAYWDWVRFHFPF
uniref:Complex III subunit 9 n=1 Tax=Angiostrongylus cantonensis TaxID=6313 RepID=A0A0K0DN01_ANGCA